MTTLTHTIPAGSPTERLDQYLLRVVPESSRSQIRRWMEAGRVRLNGQVPKPSHRVRPGEKLAVELLPPRTLEVVPEPIPLSILHEDDHLLIVDKPAGLVVHPAPGHPGGTLVNALAHHSKKLSSVAGPFKPGIVHRLDKDTSGLLVVAKDDATHRALARQFASRKVRRVYLAVVQGVVQREEGTIRAPIGRHPVKRQKMAVDTVRSREAITRYRVLKRYRKATLLELTPETGRTHQLRVHLAHLGHPLLGDSRYGVWGGFSRQALHAHRLGFEHPGAHQWVEFVSPVPLDLQQALERM